MKHNNAYQSPYITLFLFLILFYSHTHTQSTEQTAKANKNEIGYQITLVNVLINKELNEKKPANILNSKLVLFYEK